MWSRGFILLCGIVFVVGLVTGPVQMLFPVYAETILKETALFAALLRALPIGLGGISALIGGTLSDRFGRKPTVLIGMTGAVVVGGLFTTQAPLFFGVSSVMKASHPASKLRADRRISSVLCRRVGWDGRQGGTSSVALSGAQSAVPSQVKSLTVLGMVFSAPVR
jgi:MFS family permease